MRPAEEWFAIAGDDDGEGRGNAQMKGGSGEYRGISASFHDLVGSVGGRLCGLVVGGGTSKLPGRMRSEQEDQHALPTATCTPKEPRLRQDRSSSSATPSMLGGRSPYVRVPPQASVLIRSFASRLSTKTLEPSPAMRLAEATLHGTHPCRRHWQVQANMGRSNGETEIFGASVFVCVSPRITRVGTWTSQRPQQVRDYLRVHSFGCRCVSHHRHQYQNQTGMTMCLDILCGVNWSSL